MRMNNEVVTMLAKAIITCISVILTTFIIPWIKSKIDAEKLLKIEEICELAVRCAEQIYTPEQWSEKKAYVLDYMLEKVNEIGIDLALEDINNLIEGIVNEVKRG